MVRHSNHPYLEHSSKCSVSLTDVYRQCLNAKTTIIRPFTKFNCNYCQKTENDQKACLEALIHHPGLQDDENIKHIMKFWIYPYLNRSFNLKKFLILLHNSLHAAGSIKSLSTHPGAAHNIIVNNDVESGATAAVSLFKEYVEIIRDASKKGKKDAAAVLEKAAAEGKDNEGKIAASTIEKAAIEKAVAEELAKDQEWECVGVADHAYGEMDEDDWEMVETLVLETVYRKKRDWVALDFDMRIWRCWLICRCSFPEPAGECHRLLLFERLAWWTLLSAFLFNKT